MADKRSPLNTGRTKARNRRRQERNAGNREHRAALQREKASKGSPMEVATLQVKIDALSRGFRE